jgi:rhodanese-related sulfurtransferase
MMKCMKRLPAAIGAVTLTALLAACGSTAAPGSQAPVEPAAATAMPEAAGAGQPTDASAALLQNQAAPAASTPMAVADAFADGGPRMVPAATVAQAVQAGVDIVFVDARPALDYEAGHVPGAINVPYSEPEQHLEKLPKDKWIVAYCECPNAEASQVANALENNGFQKVRVIEDGLGAWQALGNELVAGTAESG